jgi:hypothetical protein
MIGINPPLPLPFYDSTDKQNFRDKYCYNDICTFKLLTHPRRLIPFQWLRPSRYNLITTLKLVCADDAGYEVDLLPLLPAPLTIVTNTTTEQDRIIYFADADMTSDMPCGCYYIEMSDGVSTWYSEVICIVEFDDAGQGEVCFEIQPGVGLCIDIGELCLTL